MSKKTYLLQSLIIHEPGMNKIFLYTNDLYELQYQLLINRRKKVRKNYLKDVKAFASYSNSMKNNYPNIDDYNLANKRKMLIIFDDMFAYMISYKRV